MRCLQILAGLDINIDKSLNSVGLFAILWTVAYQAPLSMGFSRQEYWSGLPFPSPGDLPDPGIEPGSPALQADALPSEFDCINLHSHQQCKRFPFSHSLQHLLFIDFFLVVK